MLAEQRAARSSRAEGARITTGSIHGPVFFVPLMSEVHTRLFTACLIYSLAVGGWAFFIAFKGRNLDSNFWGALAINELLFVAGGLFDLFLLLNGGILPGRPWDRVWRRPCPRASCNR